MSWANKITVHLSSLTVYLLSSIVHIFHHRFIHNHNHYSNHLNPKNLFSELHSGSLFTGFVSTTEATHFLGGESFSLGPTPVCLWKRYEDYSSGGTACARRRQRTLLMPHGV